MIKGSALERLGILLLCFGYLTVGSVTAVVAGTYTSRYSNADVLHLLVFELIAGTAAIVLLQYRGWTPGDFGFAITRRSTLGALALYFGTNLLCVLTWLALQPLGIFGKWDELGAEFAVTPALLLLFFVVNSFFEELFVVGYVIEATPSHEPAFAVSVSTLVRLGYHTYQGPEALAWIVPLGLVFALVYLRWRNLWPLVLAHTLMNVAVWVSS